MATANDQPAAPQEGQAPAATGIQTSPPDAPPAGPTAVQPAPTEGGSIPLPAPPAAPPARPRWTPERVRLWTDRLDAVLAGLVVLVAVLFGSFAARNSDLWMHLAAGRL